MFPFRYRCVALVAGIALLAAACGGEDDTDDASADETTATTAAAGPESDDDATDQADGEAAPDADDADADGSDGAEIEQGPIEAGDHTTAWLGTELSFTLDDGWEVSESKPGFVVISDVDRENQFNDAIVLIRPDGLAGPGEATTLPPPDSFSGDPTDVAAWADATGEVEVTAESTLDIDGNTAAVTSFRLDPAGTGTIEGGCGPTDDDRCVFFSSNGPISPPQLIARTSEIYRTVVIEQADLPPLVAFLAANESKEGWFDERAMPVIQSMTLGPPADRPGVDVNPNGILTQEFAAIEAGTWTVETLGTPFTVDIEGDWFVQPNSDGFVVFTDPESAGPGDLDVVLIRALNMSDPTDYGVDLDVLSVEPLRAPEDWLAEAPEGLTASATEPVTVGGLDGITFQVTIDDESICRDDELGCVPFVGAGPDGSGFSFDTGFTYRLIWLEQGDLAPIVINVGAPAGEEGWFDTAQGLLDTIEFGDPAPHPLLEG